MQYTKCTNKRTGKSVILPKASSINLEEVREFTTKYRVEVYTYGSEDAKQLVGYTGEGFIVFMPEGKVESKTTFFSDDVDGDVYNFEDITTNENI